ncbi:MAG: BBP7 family outer membrane beta-barrel protein [Planctomycetes bacterium]|nr:BBP7 family outer membrane beta-barrel protein [Planctomycetota bacterium]
MMLESRAPILFVVSVLLVSARARAEAPAAQPAAPGIMHQGRFIGFVPAHLKTERNAASAAAAPSTETIHQAEFVSDAVPQPEDWVELLAVPSVGDVPVGSVVEEGVPSLPIHRCAPFCGNTPYFWGRAEYLLWWTKGMDVPPLATTSPAGAPLNQSGVLGQPGTTVLFGQTGLNDESRSGGRFTLGAWLDPCRRHGLEANYLYLETETAAFSASDKDFPILARPFFNVQNNIQDARRIAFPGDVSGSLNIQVETEFQAFEALYRVQPCNAPSPDVEFVLGYRFGELEDGVTIRESTQALAAPIAGTTFDLRDEFHSRNTFHGGELGIVFACRPHVWWRLEAAAKIGLGVTDSRASIIGQTTTTTGGGAATTQAGLLAQSTNIGVFEQSAFSTLSELDLMLRRRVNSGLSLFVGYSVLYWSDVARAGDQIDVGVNPSQIPPGMLAGPPRPAFAFEQTGFWAQGLRFGGDFAY